MKKLIITIFSLLLTVNVLAQRVDYTKPDSLRVVTLMKRAQALKSKSMASYMLFFGRALRGVPYVAKTLEKNSQEQLVVNLRQLDCTTYVETVLALARSMAKGQPSLSGSWLTSSRPTLPSPACRR